MGDLTRGHTYSDSGAGAAVNSTNLHAHVDDAVINAGAVTTSKLGTGAVSADKLASDAVTAAKILADAVDGTKIADDSIDSEHLAAGAIDLEHFSPAARPVNYDFDPASALAAGRSGLVPAPSAGDQSKFLRADGWSSLDAPINAAVAAAPGIAFSNHQTFI